MTSQSNDQTVRAHHQFDAAGRVPGRFAAEIAILLMGKHKVSYRPNADEGDYVEVINAGQLEFSGKKLEQKVYQSFSGFPGGLKTLGLKKLFKDNPDEVLRRAVYRMLPKNKLRSEMIKRLTFKSDHE